MNDSFNNDESEYQNQSDNYTQNESERDLFGNILTDDSVPASDVLSCFREVSEKLENSKTNQLPKSFRTYTNQTPYNLPSGRKVKHSLKNVRPRIYDGYDINKNKKETKSADHNVKKKFGSPERDKQISDRMYGYFTKYSANYKKRQNKYTSEIENKQNASKMIPRSRKLMVAKFINDFELAYAMHFPNNIEKIDDKSILTYDEIQICFESMGLLSKNDPSLMLKLFELLDTHIKGHIYYKKLKKLLFSLALQKKPTELETPTANNNNSKKDSTLDKKVDENKDSSKSIQHISIHPTLLDESEQPSKQTPPPKTDNDESDDSVFNSPKSPLESIKSKLSSIKIENFTAHISPEMKAKQKFSFANSDTTNSDNNKTQKNNNAISKTSNYSTKHQTHANKSKHQIRKELLNCIQKLYSSKLYLSRKDQTNVQKLIMTPEKSPYDKTKNKTKRVSFQSQKNSSANAKSEDFIQRISQQISMFNDRQEKIRSKWKKQLQEKKEREIVHKQWSRASTSKKSRTASITQTRTIDSDSTSTAMPIPNNETFVKLYNDAQNRTKRQNKRIAERMESENKKIEQLPFHPTLPERNKDLKKLQEFLEKNENARYPLGYQDAIQRIRQQQLKKEQKGVEEKLSKQKAEDKWQQRKQYLEGLRRKQELATELEENPNQGFCTYQELAKKQFKTLKDDI